MLSWLSSFALAFSPSEHQALASRCVAEEAEACLALAEGLALLAAEDPSWWKEPARWALWEARSLRRTAGPRVGPEPDPSGLVQVVDREGRPVPGVRVAYRGDEGAKGEVVSDLAGRMLGTANVELFTALPSVREGERLVLESQSSLPEPIWPAPGSKAELFGRWRVSDALLGDLIVLLGPNELRGEMEARQLETLEGMLYVLGPDALVHVRHRAPEVGDPRSRMSSLAYARLARAPAPQGLAPTFAWAAGDRVQVRDRRGKGETFELAVEQAPEELRVTLDGEPWIAVTPEGWASGPELGLWEALVHRWIGAGLQRGERAVEQTVSPSGYLFETTTTFRRWVRCPAGRCVRIHVEDWRPHLPRDGATWTITFDPATLRPYRLDRREVASGTTPFEPRRNDSVSLEFVWAD